METIMTPTVYSALDKQMDAMTKLGEMIAKSGFNGCTKVEQGVIIAFTCLAENITPLDFARKYDLISGRPTKKAAVMLAELRETYKGDFDWITDGDDELKATIVLTYGGKKKSPVSFSIEEAKRKGLTGKDNWKKQPAEMLRARCTTKALRMHVPEIAAGIYDPDEVNGRVKEIADSKKELELLINDRNDIEKEAIDNFIKSKWPKGMPVAKAKLAVENFDTFLLKAIKEGGLT